MSKQNSDRPIGIFDSGIGGLTVAHAIKKQLPKEEILYFGDTAHLPYGEKSPEAIMQFADRITSFLQNEGSKMAIVACNTASAIAFEHLKEKWGEQLLLLNVIDPVVDELTTIQESGKVGVIGTKATIRSNAYENKLRKVRPELQVASLATPLLVSMIEEGFFNNKLSHTIIEAYLKYPDFAEIESMILGCTHFPLIREEIQSFLGEKVQIFDSTDAVARAAGRLLKEQGLLREKEGHAGRFLVSDYTHSFEQTSRIFFGEEIHLQAYPLWDELAQEL